MTSGLVAAGFGAAAVAIWLVWTMLRQRHGERVDRDAVNLEIYRQRRAEIRTEAEGAPSAGVGEALETELGLALLDAEGGPATAMDDRPLRRPLVLGAVALFVLASLLLYARWGEPDATALLDVGDILRREASAGELARAAALLSRRVERIRSDRDSWYYLGHVRLQQSDYAGAADAFAAVHRLGGAGFELDVAWAQARYLADGASIAAATRAIIDRVLAIDADHPIMLEMLAMDAVRRGDFAESVRHMERALGQPLPAQRRELYEQAIARSRAQMDADRPRIEVTVTVEESADRPAWLMVFARSPQGGIPRAVLRRPIQSTQTVVLDDASSMSPASPLSAAGPVIVTARASTAGGAAAGPGDWQAASAPVDPRERPRVTLALERPADAPAPSPEAPGLAVHVSLGPGVALAPSTPVFVIARDPDRPGPPLAVRRLVAADLPARIVLTDADAMVPGRAMAAAGAVAVLARAAVGGSASARPGDFESATRAAEFGGGPVDLVIDRELTDG